MSVWRCDTSHLSDREGHADVGLGRGQRQLQDTPIHLRGYRTASTAQHMDEDDGKGRSGGGVTSAELFQSVSGRPHYGRVLGQHRYELADAAVTSEAGEERETDIHHALGLRDHDRAPSKPCQPMSLPGVVPLDAMRLVLTRVALPHRQHVIDSIVVRAVKARPPACEPLDQALAGRLVTTAALPVQLA